MRLRESAILAKEGSYDYFTTTLSISPYKDSQILNEIGIKLSKELDIKYLYADFKKREGYVFLKTNNGRPARILFSEAFAVNNQAQYDGYGVIKKYYGHLKSQGKDVFCCCVGKIIKDDFGTTVLPDNYICFRVDDKDYYGVLSTVNRLAI
jgi:hypothetical protein